MKKMKIINLTPDSFREESRALAKDLPRLMQGADIYDLGAVSTRPGADPVSPETEWERLRPALDYVKSLGEGRPAISIDTSRASIVKRSYELIGPFIVNDVLCGEDPLMLPTVRKLGLSYVAMHHRGTPRTMDTLCDYPQGVVNAVLEFFRDFALKADGIDWILDPGFGFAKTDAQNMELLQNLRTFKQFGRPVLVGISHKRFTRGRSSELEALAESLGADIIRKH